MKILITGGAGFIGSHFTRQLLSGAYPAFVDAEVTVLDALTYAGNLANLEPIADNPRYTFVHGNICDGALLTSLLPGHDAIVHFAAETHVVYYPGWWEGASVGSLYVNNKAWEELPKQYKAMVETAAGLVTSWMVPKYDAGNPAALRRLVASGTELRPFPRAVLEPCFAEAYKYYDELSAKDPKFKKIYDSLKAFRADQNLWFRVAENTFDNFNFSMSAQGR